MYFIYGKYHCFNVISGIENKGEGVLVRALEPLNFNEKCKGPGLLTEALKIDKNFHRQNIFNNEGLRLVDSERGKDFEVVESFRIGVKRDFRAIL